MNKRHCIMQKTFIEDVRCMPNDKKKVSGESNLHKISLCVAQYANSTFFLPIGSRKSDDASDSST